MGLPCEVSVDERILGAMRLQDVKTRKPYFRDQTVTLQRLWWPCTVNSKWFRNLKVYSCGAGWNVVKCCMGCSSGILFAKIINGLLVTAYERGLRWWNFRNYKSKCGAYTSWTFLRQISRVARRWLKDMTDDEIMNLNRAGRWWDPYKVYACVSESTSHKVNRLLSWRKPLSYGHV